MLPVALLIALMLPPGQAAPTVQNGAALNGIVQQWGGRISRPLALLAPAKGYINNDRDLNALWQAWSIKGETPTVDFTKYLIVVNTSRSSVFKVQAIQVDGTGEMKTVLIATPDIRPDFAFVLTLTERRGAKTLHGTPIE